MNKKTHKYTKIWERRKKNTVSLVFVNNTCFFYLCSYCSTVGDTQTQHKYSSMKQWIREEWASPAHTAVSIMMTPWRAPQTSSFLALPHAYGNEPSFPVFKQHTKKRGPGHKTVTEAVFPYQFRMNRALWTHALLQTRLPAHASLESPGCSLSWPAGGDSKTNEK